MLSPSALLRGLTSRILPSANFDSPNVDVAARVGRYGEAYALSLVRKQHLLADEGCYFVANNAQTGVAINTATAFSAANPSLAIANIDTPTNSNAKRIYLDYVNLLITAAGTAASGLTAMQMAVYLDVGNRIASVATVLNPVSPNMDVTPKSIASVTFGAVSATTATAAVRPIVGLRTLRIAVSATVLNLANEQILLTFGAAEAVNFTNASAIASSLVPSQEFLQQPLPPVIIGPGQTGLIYLWQATGATNVATTFAPEVGWWER